MEAFGIWFLFMLILIFYFLPAVIASKRNTKHGGGGTIFLINLIFGWTVLGLDRRAHLGDCRGAGRGKK